METKIVKGSIAYINDCEDTLVNSELGIKYFPKKGSARTSLEEGFAKEEIYIAMDINQNYKGFIWIIFDGIFHSFPYLHIVAVNQESRNQGIGKNLLKFFEDSCLKNYSKIFLVVADFNPDAERLYKKIGYIQVGTIPSLYMEGITEHLMMKSREDNK